MPYGESPNEMGHSPAEMESAKQEKYNLMHDNPVAKHASWLSKHAQSSRMSPLEQKRPDPKSLINEKGQSQDDVMEDRESKVTNFRNKIKGLEFTSQDQVDRANAIDKVNVDMYNKAADSITGVNDAYNLKVDAYNNSLKKKNANIEDILNQG